MKERRKRVVRTPEGFEVDVSSGEVVEQSPVDFEHPEYRVFDYSDYLEKSHYHPLRLPLADRDRISDMCRDDESINRVLDRILPGLVMFLRSILLSSLCSAEGGSQTSFPGLEVVRRVVESRLSMSAGEATAYDVGGFVGLITFRCLKNAGIDEEKILDALRAVEGSKHTENLVYSLVESLRDVISKSLNYALIRWVSRPNEDIDLDHASKVLGAPVKRARRALQIVTKIDSLGVQITSKKIDISSGINERDRVLEVLNKLSRRLGVELSAPQPMVATAVLRLPFEVDFENMKRFSNAILQGSRMKLEGSFWTALVFKRTLNIYVNLQGSINRLRSAIAEALPMVCKFAKT